MNPLYLLLGASGSGRRFLWSDLMASVDVSGPVVSLSHADEAATAASVEDVYPLTYRYEENDRSPWFLEADELPKDPGSVFLCTDGGRNPVDQVEAIAHWLPQAGLDVARVLTLVDCRRLEAQPSLLAWYEACIHFSDTVLLGNREGVSNRWIADFQGRFEKLCLPCSFELIKKGVASNPARLLYPEARRMSLVFDESPAFVQADGFSDETEINFDPNDPESEDEETPEDPYLARLDSGVRIKRLPDIRDFPPVATN